jgi:hypothetical protein
MNGGPITKSSSQQLHLTNNSSNENLPDKTANTLYSANEHRLNGVLGIGQAIELKNGLGHSHELFKQPNHLEVELAQLKEKYETEKDRVLIEVRQALSELAKKIPTLDKTISKIINQPSSKSTGLDTYHLNFFIRLKNYILSTLENISEAVLWSNSFLDKISKKNKNNLNKFSDESSPSRTVN